MTWRHLLTHNVQCAKCKTVENIHSKVVLRFKFKPLDSESNFLFRLKRLMLFQLKILDSKIGCIGTTLMYRNKFGKATMKLESRNSNKEIPHRISVRFVKHAYSSRLIDQLPLSWLSEINWIFQAEILLIFDNISCMNLNTIYDYVDCLEWVYIFNTT